MSGVQHIKVSEDDDGQRLDRWLKKAAPGLSYVAAQKLLRKGQIRVDSKRAKPDTRLQAGQEVRIPPVSTPPPGERKAPRLSDKDIGFMRDLVIYEDEHVIALNKPSGLAVQGGSGTKKHIDGMLDALADKNDVRPRLVHRLDKETSGILLLARSAAAARKLGEAFKKRQVEKIYWALITPVPEIYEGTIKAPLAKSSGNFEKMEVDEEEGKYALTDYAVLDQAGHDVAFCAFKPVTGRTHQIRAHCQILGSPILGDHKYKAERDPEAKKPEVDVSALPLAKRLHLHARSVSLLHPMRAGRLTVEAPLPPDLVKSWKVFGFDPNSKERGL